MGVRFIDALGLKDDRTMLMVALTAPGVATGEILEIWGDCPTLESKLRLWCRSTERTILSVEEWALMKRIQIQF
jgi:TusA-related sulfurtransferase